MFYGLDLNWLTQCGQVLYEVALKSSYHEPFFHVRHYKPNIPPAALMFINSNVKNNCDILSNEFVQDFLENPKFKNATKLSTLSKSSGPIVQCGSFTYLMDSLTNFLPAFVPKICKRVANSRKYRDCSGPKIQNCT